MQATPVIQRFAARYDQGTANNLESMIIEMGIDPSAALSAESFLVKIMTIACEAESALPEAAKQNNFAWTIGEGGQYRATIKAAVQTTTDVIG